MTSDETGTNQLQAGRTTPSVSHFFAVFEAGLWTDGEMIEAAKEKTSEFGEPTGPVDLSTHDLTTTGRIVIALVEYVPDRPPSEMVTDDGAWLPFIRRFT